MIVQLVPEVRHWLGGRREDPYRYHVWLKAHASTGDPNPQNAVWALHQAVYGAGPDTVRIQVSRGGTLLEADVGLLGDSVAGWGFWRNHPGSYGPFPVWGHRQPC